MYTTPYCGQTYLTRQSRMCNDPICYDHYLQFCRKLIVPNYPLSTDFYQINFQFNNALFQNSKVIQLLFVGVVIIGRSQIRAQASQPIPYTDTLTLFTLGIGYSFKLALFYNISSLNSLLVLLYDLGRMSPNFSVIIQ